MGSASEKMTCPTCRQPLALAAGESGGALLRCGHCQIDFRLDLDAGAEVTAGTAAPAGTQPTIQLGPALEAHWQKTLVTAARPGAPGSAADAALPARTLKPDATILIEPGDRPSLRPTSLPRVQIATAAGAATGAATAATGSPVALEILAKLGAGGMGTVYRARQTALGRDVALKQIHPGDASNETVQMFLHEAQATGLLDHPNIVPVHELGIDTQGQVFYTMKLVRGKPWSDFLSAPHPAAATAAPPAKTLDLAAHLEILLKVADAVAFAHDKGILHRDLKPDNVMIGDFGEVLVVDWGLACTFNRAQPGTFDLPQAAAVSSPCGTPQYMPPEMALGLGRQIGAPSDVYLLGAILYEILHRRPPHQAGSVWQILRTAARNTIAWQPPHGEPAATYFQVFEPLLRRALHSDTRQRFADAGQFGAELRLSLRHFDSIALARQAQSRLARHTAAAPSPASPTLPAGPAAAPAAANTYAEFDEALAALRGALSSWPENSLAQTTQLAGHAAYARFALSRGDLALAAAQLHAAQAAAARCPAAAPAENLPRLQQQIQTAQADTARRAARLKLLQRAVAALALLFVGGAAAALLWINAARERAVQAEHDTATERDKAIVAEKNAATERDKAVTAEHQAVAERDRTARTAYVATVGMASRYAYDGNTLRADQLLAETPPQFRGWEYDWVRSKAHQELATWRPGAEAFPQLLAVHPTRPAALVAEYPANELLLWDAAADKIERRFAMPGGPACCATFNADASRILAAGDHDKIVLFDTATGAVLKIIDHKLLLPRLCRFTPDGSHFVIDDDQGQILYGDSASGAIVNTIPTPQNAIACGAMRADGKELLIGLNGGELVRLRLPDGEEVGRDQAAEGDIYACGYLDETTGIAVVADGEMVPWLGAVQVNFGDAETPTSNLWTIETQAIQAATIAADGQTVAVATYEQRLKVWRADGQALFRLEDNAYLRLQGHTDRLSQVCLADDGRLGATTAGDGSIKLWNLLGLQSVHFFRRHVGVVQAFAPLPDGKNFLTAGFNGEVLLHHTADFQTRELLTTPDESKVYSLTVDASGAWAVSGDAGGRVLRWNLKTRQLENQVTTTTEEPFICQYQPRGDKLLIAPRQGPVAVWDPAATKSLATLNPGERQVLCAAAFSPDGATVMLAEQGELRAWDWQAGVVRWTVPLPPTALLHRLAFSPDGRLLCGAGHDGNLLLWRWSAAAAPPPPTVLRGHAGVIADCDFSPDGRRLVSGSYDRTVKLWDLEQGRELLSYNTKLTDTTTGIIYGDSDIISYDHACNVDHVWFTGDGKGLVYCKSDGTPVLLQPPADNLAEYARALKAYQADAEPRRLPP